LHCSLIICCTRVCW